MEGPPCRRNLLRGPRTVKGGREERATARQGRSFLFFLFDVFLDGLDEKRAFLFGHQPLGMGLGLCFFRVIIRGDRLMRVIVNDPDDALARGLDRASPFGFCLGLLLFYRGFLLVPLVLAFLVSFGLSFSSSFFFVFFIVFVFVAFLLLATVFIFIKARTHFTIIQGSSPSHNGCSPSCANGR